MLTFTEFARQHAGMFLWDSDAGLIDGKPCLDVLVYETEEDMDRDDNSLAIARATVIADD